MFYIGLVNSNSKILFVMLYRFGWINTLLKKEFSLTNFQHASYLEAFIDFIRLFKPE